GATPPPLQLHFENVLAVISDSVPADQLPDPIGPGNALTLVPPPCCAGGNRHAALFANVGGNLQTIGGHSYGGFSLDGGLELSINRSVSMEGIFGYHRISRTIAGDPSLYQFSGNVKAYFLNHGHFNAFVNGGPGAYKIGGGSTYFGGNAGIGMLL